MADIEEPIVDAGGVPIPTAPAPPPDGPTVEQLATELAAEREARKSDQAAAEGRIKKEQEVVARQGQIAAQYGISLDDTANYQPPPSTGGYQQPVPEPAEEDDDFDWSHPRTAIKQLAQAEAQALLRQALPQVIGLIDQSIQPTLKHSIPDYDEIKEDLGDALKAVNCRTLTELRAYNNPALESLVLNAARGAKAARTPAVPTEPVVPAVTAVDTQRIAEEANRLGRAQAAAMGGRSAAPGAAGASEWGELDADEIEYAKELGCANEEQYMAGFGPARPLAKKPGGSS